MKRACLAATVMMLIGCGDREDPVARGGITNPGRASGSRPDEEEPIDPYSGWLSVAKGSFAGTVGTVTFDEVNAFVIGGAWPDSGSFQLDTYDPEWAMVAVQTDKPLVTAELGPLAAVGVGCSRDQELDVVDVVLTGRGGGDLGPDSVRLDIDLLIYGTLDPVAVSLTFSPLPP